MFEVDDLTQVYLLNFLGVCSCFDLFVNGKYVGYSEGSHNTAEFDISGYLVSGQNEILLAVYKWCNGTYLECQDMFRENGIFRDVYIIRENAVHTASLKESSYCPKRKSESDLLEDLKSPSYFTKKQVQRNAGRPCAVGVSLYLLFFLHIT